MNISDMNIDHIFGERLKYLRTEVLHMTQKDFAALLCIPQPTLSAYEKGRINPTIDAAMNIAKIGNVSLDWLCGRDESRMDYMSDLARFLFDLYDAEQFSCQTDMIETGECTEDIEQDKEIRKRISLTFFADDKVYNSDWVYSEEVYQLIKTVSELHSELIHYDCSQDYYNTKKAMIIDSYRNLPITRIDLSGISESERTRLRKEKLMEELKKEMMNEAKNS